MDENKTPEHLLEQITQLLQKIQNHTKPLGEIPPDIEYKLGILEKAVHAFEQLNAMTYQQSNLDMAQIRENPEIKSQNQPLLEKSTLIENQAKLLYLKLGLTLQGRKDKEKKQQQKDDPELQEEIKKHKHRQKKFKRMGGDKGWLPL